MIHPVAVGCVVFRFQLIEQDESTIIPNVFSTPLITSSFAFTHGGITAYLIGDRQPE